LEEAEPIKRLQFSSPARFSEADQRLPSSLSPPLLERGEAGRKRGKVHRSSEVRAEGPVHIFILMTTLLYHRNTATMKKIDFKIHN
jgi:hypothetical protein